MPEIGETGTRRYYERVRLTLVYELRVEHPREWFDESRAALLSIAAARPLPVARSRDPFRSRRGSQKRPPAVTVVEMRAAGIRPR